MDEATKEVAKEKSDVINERIGFPDYILSDTKLEDRYDGVRACRTFYVVVVTSCFLLFQLNTSSLSHFDNFANILAFRAQQTLKTLREEVDKNM